MYDSIINYSFNIITGVLTLYISSSFNRVGICLLVYHYVSEALFHAARLIYFADKTESGSKGILTDFTKMKCIFMSSSILCYFADTYISGWFRLLLHPMDGLGEKTFSTGLTD
ncbi:hypothetical protein J437_LFUL008485 [Ladona fulva]|uniref:Uncharacterized protein n=1 Tax=Ladona fulva TaxID=123851 RepID=A0A8K0NZJ0_LADFU|nr:hypothetical protein J437_LFUL008485 [Ladona fulva]